MMYQLKKQKTKTKPNTEITPHPIASVKPELSDRVLDAHVSVSLTAAARHSAWSPSELLFQPAGAMNVHTFYALPPVST